MPNAEMIHAAHAERREVQLMQLYAATETAVEDLTARYLALREDALADPALEGAVLDAYVELEQLESELARIARSL